MVKVSRFLGSLWGHFGDVRSRETCIHQPSGTASERVKIHPHFTGVLRAFSGHWIAETKSAGQVQPLQFHAQTSRHGADSLPTQRRPAISSRAGLEALARSPGLAYQPPNLTPLRVPVIPRGPSFDG